MGRLIKIAIADDHPLVISGLRHMLEGNEGMKVVGAYANGRELLAGIGHDAPDVLLLDITMPGQTGVELAQAVAQGYPNVRIVALTNHDDNYHLVRMLEAGALGYVLKTTTAPVLLLAITDAHAGKLYIDKAMQASRVAKVAGGKEVPKLTNREREVLQLLVCNLNSREVSERLSISKRTVDNHRQHLMMKLEVNSIGALLQRAMELGLVPR